MKKIVNEEYEKYLEELDKYDNEIKQAIKNFKSASTDEESDKWQLRIRTLEAGREDLYKIRGKLFNKSSDDSAIKIGDSITIIYVDEEEEFKFKLTGSFDNSEENKISILSPLGGSVYGAKEGELVSFKVRKTSPEVKVLIKKVTRI